MPLCNFAGEEDLCNKTHGGACNLGMQPGSGHPEPKGVESVWILRLGTQALVSDSLPLTDNLGLFLHLEIEMIIPTT